MTKNQVNRKEMYDAVISFLDASPEKWSTIPRLAEAKNNFSVINMNIENAALEQQAANVVMGNSKKKLKHQLAGKADIFNDVLEAYAGINDLPELESRMADSASDLKSLRNEDFVSKVKEIVSHTETYQEELIEDYGLTSGMVDDFKADVDRFLELNGMPSTYRIASTQATRDLEGLFSEANQVLTKQLDNLMKIFKRRDPAFHNGYIAARVIVDD
jgi:hypothetical protein